MASLVWATTWGHRRPPACAWPAPPRPPRYTLWVPLCVLLRGYVLVPRPPDAVVHGDCKGNMRPSDVSHIRRTRPRNSRKSSWPTTLSPATRPYKERYGMRQRSSVAFMRFMLPSWEKRVAGEGRRVGTPLAISFRGRARLTAAMPPHGTIVARFQHESHECHRGRGMPVLECSWCRHAQVSRMAWWYAGRCMPQLCMGGKTMSTRAVVRHTHAAEQYGHTARPD